MIREEPSGRVSIEREVIAPTVTFLLVYFGVLATLLYSVAASSVTAFHAAGLAAAIVATITTKTLFKVDGRRLEPRLAAGKGIAGFLHRNRSADVMRGAAVGVVIILVTDLLLVAGQRVEHSWSGAFPLSAVLWLFIPAAIHEEIVFRGEAFGRLARWRPTVAIAATSLLFALAHGANTGIGRVALLNILLAGVLLGLIRAANGLGAAISLHLFWNLASGVLLGHEVSGQLLDRTLFSSRDHGPELATGGAFGLEGSAVMSVVVATSTWLVWRLSRRNQASATSVVASDIIAVPPGSGAGSPEKTITEKQ